MSKKRLPPVVLGPTASEAIDSMANFKLEAAKKLAFEQCIRRIEQERGNQPISKEERHGIWTHLEVHYASSPMRQHFRRVAEQANNEAAKECAAFRLAEIRMEQPTDVDDRVKILADHENDFRNPLARRGIELRMGKEKAIIEQERAKKMEEDVLGENSDLDSEWTQRVRHADGQFEMMKPFLADLLPQYQSSSSD